MRLRSLVAPYALLVAAGLIAGCGSPATTQAPASGGAASGKDNDSADVGPLLYTAAKPPVLQTTPIRGGEAMVIHSTAQFDDRQQETLGLEFAIGQPGLLEQGGAADLKPRQVTAMIDNAHHVGFGIAD